MSKVRRLINLYKLLGANDRLSALENRADRLQRRLQDQGERLRDQRERLQDQGARLQEQRANLQAQIDDLQEHGTNLQIDLHKQGSGLQDHIHDLQVHLSDQVDLLKSSLEVPEGLIEEFSEWKARNPLPEQPLVTVTVTTYNRPRLLTERCIPSVLDQTYDNLELIVVGDGCTEETEEAVGKIDDPRLTFFNLSERGLYPADPQRRWMVAGTPAGNKALGMAQGDFVTHLDDDDEYVPDRLEKLVKFAVENDCDFVWHPFWWEFDADDWKLWEASNFMRDQVTNGSAFYRSWFKKIEGNINAHRLMEPGDWNRFRRMKYISRVSLRYPEPLLKHYRERSQS